MALGASRISSLAASSFAAASARPYSSGRVGSSTSQGPVESSEFSANIGLNDNGIAQSNDNGSTDSDGQRRDSSRQFTPFLTRAAYGYQVEDTDMSSGGALGGDRLFMSDIMRAVGTYETNLRTTNPTTVRPGSVMNVLF
jgi:hypothetical protein